MYTSSQGLDGAVVTSGTFIVDALALYSILLVGDSEGCLCCLEENMEWGSVWDGPAIAASEGNVTKPKCHCSFLLATLLFGVFTDPKEVVESNVDEVCPCLVLVFVAPLFACSGQEVCCEGDRDCQLWC